MAVDRDPRKRPRVKVAELVSPSAQAVAEEAFRLARELSLELREDEMVGAFGATMRRLLPGRWLCLRVVDPESQELTSLVADGPLAVEGRGAMVRAPLVLRRSALRQTRLPETITTGGRVRIDERYEPVFLGEEGPVEGFAVPLVAAGQFLGLINVEYPDGANGLGEVDEAAVIPLANQLSVALRNLHLLGEARYYRDYLRQMIEVANALIVVADRRGAISVMNAALQRYGGWDGSVVGAPIATLDHTSERVELVVPAAPGTGLADLLRRGLDGEEVVHHEVEIPRLIGVPGRAVFNTSVLRSADGRIDGVIAIGQDTAHVRSLELQVIQADKLATLGQLAAGVVHELNNPLTAITVYGDYLVRLLDRVQSGQSQPKTADVEKARKITDAAQRIQKLTRDLMTYARPTGDFEQIQINDVVRHAVSLCEHVIKWSEARLVYRLVGNLPKVQAIPSQLHQVLINLITNACHALPAPEQVITIGTWTDSDGVWIEVEDTGVGIDEQDQPRVFQPFFTTKTEGRGTGLGLSIVKNIVEGHGGRITLRSQPGQGTAFRIVLPISPASPGTPGSEPHPT